MAVRLLILCILVGAASRASADAPSRPAGMAADDLRGQGKAAVERVSEGQLRVSRRPVAVIDLSNDQAVRDVANRLLELLAAHGELAPPAISDGAALVDKLPPDDQPRLAEAHRKLRAAEQNLALRRFREAAIDAVEGQELLLHVTPRAAIALYADLALALGQSRLGEQNDAEAREAFALTHRLDPTRALDDLHYLPEVVQTFEAVKQGNPGTGSIAVRGAGRVWIDGEDVGSAPGEFKVALGRHVVWLTGLLRETAGKEVLVTPTRPGDATIMDGSLTRPQKVVRYRVALSQAADPATRASAMAALAAFVNVHEAVLLAMENGQITWQLWRDRAPGFSLVRDLGRDSPVEILDELAPPRPTPLRDAPPPSAEVRWYKLRGVQIGIAAGVVLGAIAGFVWSRYNESPRAWEPNTTFPNPSK